MEPPPAACAACAKNPQAHLDPLCDPADWEQVLDASDSAPVGHASEEGRLVAALKDIAARHGAQVVAQEWVVLPRPNAGRAVGGDLVLRLACGTDVVLEAKWISGHEGAARVRRTAARSTVARQARRYALLWRARAASPPPPALVIAATLTNDEGACGPQALDRAMPPEHVASAEAAAMLRSLPPRHRAVVEAAAAAVRGETPGAGDGDDSKTAQLREVQRQLRELQEKMELLLLPEEPEPPATPAPEAPVSALSLIHI